MTEEVALALERAVLNGEYPPNSRFPSEREIVKRFRITRRGAQAAIETLENRGIVYRIERGGTFVKGAAARTVEAPASTPLKCVNFIEPVRTRVDPFAFALEEYLHGYTQGLQDHPLRVRFTSLAPGATAFETVLNPALPLKGQGCVLGDVLCVELMEWLAERDIPFVVRRFGFYDERRFPPHHGVYLNRNGASHRATRYLMELGHERIGFLGQMPREADYSNWALDWCWAYDGYASAICVAGKAVNPDYVASTMGNSMEGAAEKTARLLQSLKCPTGIVCQNDLTAFGVIKAAHDLGLRVPEDVSVIGFDNDPSGAGMTPSLTTFGGHEELAFAALKRLFDAASGECTTYSVQAIDSPMILRNSAAPPQKEAV